MTSNVVSTDDGEMILMCLSAYAGHKNTVLSHYIRTFPTQKYLPVSHWTLETLFRLSELYIYILFWNSYQLFLLFLYRRILTRGI